MEALQTRSFPTKLGGHLVLDFTNTAGQHGKERFAQYLASYDQLLAWCWRENLLSDVEVKQLYQLAEQHPEEAKQVQERAVALREAMYETFTEVIEGNEPQSIDLTLLNEMLEGAQPHRQVAPEQNGFSWSWNDGQNNLERPLWSLALASAELLTSDQLPKVRKCPNCGWLFLDTSRNRLRRWCSMDYCGSQVKSRRQYERKKAGNSPAGA